MDITKLTGQPVFIWELDLSRRPQLLELAKAGLELGALIEEILYEGQPITQAQAQQLAFKARALRQKARE